VEECAISKSSSRLLRTLRAAPLDSYRYNSADKLDLKPTLNLNHSDGASKRRLFREESRSLHFIRLTLLL
jgi:hypothetical protein